MGLSASRIETSSAITLSRVGRNDPTLTMLIVTPDVREAITALGFISPDGVGFYWPSDGNNLSTLGDAIGESTNLQTLTLCGIDTLVNMSIATAGVWGLKRNTSIQCLEILGSNLSGVMSREILNGFAANNSNLEEIWLSSCTLGRNVLSPAISKCSNLTTILLTFCAADDDILVDFVSGIRKLPEICGVDLTGNNFGRIGCEALATLLQEPNSKLVHLCLHANDEIDEDCAVILANSLVGNNKLELLHLPRNVRGIQNVRDAFSKVLCNTATINNTYYSNHTLKYIGGSLASHESVSVDYLFQLNDGHDKKQVPRQKILCHHDHIDMKPFLELDMKMLPVAISWFDRARRDTLPFAASWVHRARGDRSYILCSKFGAKKLSAIYQFVRAFPMKCVPSAPTKAGSKRKIETINGRSCSQSMLKKRILVRYRQFVRQLYQFPG